MGINLPLAHVVPVLSIVLFQLQLCDRETHWQHAWTLPRPESLEQDSWSERPGILPPHVQLVQLQRVSASSTVSYDSR